MQNIDELLFGREQFPVDVRKRSWVVIPPYHPSLAETGVDVNLVISVIGEALECMTMDFQEAVRFPSGEKQTLEYHLKRLASGQRYGRVERIGYGAVIHEFPFIDSLYIGQWGFNSTGIPGGLHSMSINPIWGIRNFRVPEHVVFKTKQLQEYRMTDRGVYHGERHVLCPYMWYPHNTGNREDVAFKALSIALNNETVKKLYPR